MKLPGENPRSIHSIEVFTIREIVRILWGTRDLSNEARAPSTRRNSLPDWRAWSCYSVPNYMGKNY